MLKNSPNHKLSKRKGRGAAAHKHGHRAEIMAIIYLWLKGYHIAAFRYRTPMAEIDIVAVKKRTLHIIEVKQRRSLDEAASALGFDQARRLKQAGLWLKQKKSRFGSFDMQIDMILLAPWAMPVHIQRALEGD
jgi:putative endonuclease